MTPDDNTVAYPGREGAHTAAACDRLFPAARLMPQLTFVDVVEAVARRDCTYGVLPIESSLAGPVNETHDLLYDSPLSIVAEAILPIRHCLVGLAGARLEDVREIRSHPMALDQCRGLLGRLPGATATVAPTTDSAAASVAELGDPGVVAIASARAARLHALDGSRGRHRRPRRLHALRSARALHTARSASRRVAHGADVRDPPQARRVARGDRAARPAGDRHGAARLPPDPDAPLRLSLRLRARWASPRRGRLRGARRDARSRPHGSA